MKKQAFLITFQGYLIVLLLSVMTLNSIMVVKVTW